MNLVPSHPRKIGLFPYALVWVVGLQLPTPDTSQAQVPRRDSSPSSFRIPYEDPGSPEPRRVAPPVELPRKLTHSERRQLSQIQNLADQLARESDQSFRRALMPLGDHLRQLAMAYSLRQSVASFGVGESREILNQQELARYQDIAKRLEQFRQPASEGWMADLALAQSHLARMQAEQAYLQREQGFLENALERQVAWAKRHVELRGLDESIGRAAPTDVIAANQFERRSQLDALPRYPTAEEYRTAYSAYRDELADLEAQMQRWNEQGAGIGRDDRLHRVRFARAQADAVLGLLNGNEKDRTEALTKAETELNGLWDRQWENYQKGTADLHDLARTWSDRQSLYDQAADLDGFYSKARQTKHGADYTRLQQLAGQTRDRRGRISADLSFINALQAEQDLVALRNQLSDPFRK